MFDVEQNSAREGGEARGPENRPAGRETEHCDRAPGDLMTPLAPTAADELVRQCCRCRRVWSGARWEWVELSEADKARASHGYCEDCFEQVKAARELRAPTVVDPLDSLLAIEYARRSWELKQEQLRLLVGG